MLTMIYMARIQNMSFFLLKVNNPSVRHPVWPPIGHPVWPPIGHPVWHPSGTPSGPPSGASSSTRRAPCWAPRLATVGHPVWPPSGTPVRPPLDRKKKKKLFFFFFGCCCRLEKRGKNILVFDPQDPRVPQAPRASQAKPREEEGFFGLVPLVTHPSSIPLLGGLTPKFLSLSFHSF
jgi:hypothetical protein